MHDPSSLAINNHKRQTLHRLLADSLGARLTQCCSPAKSDRWNLILVEQAVVAKPVGPHTSKAGSGARTCHSA